eukprot:1730700-Pleurochrysis_carterae.AAC.1
MDIVPGRTTSYLSSCPLPSPSIAHLSSVTTISTPDQYNLYLKTATIPKSIGQQCDHVSVQCGPVTRRSQHGASISLTRSSVAIVSLPRQRHLGVMPHVTLWLTAAV